MTKEEAIKKISDYVLSQIRKGHKFLYTLRGTVEYQGKEWAIFSAADCNQKDFGEHYGKVFLRLQSRENHLEEVEVFLHELAHVELTEIIINNPEIK